MEELCNNIVALTDDYHSEYGNGFAMNANHVLEWVNQFEEGDRDFILRELLHLLQQGIYISKSSAKQILKDFISRATVYFRYHNPEQFLSETHFISSQGERKSQTMMLELLNEVVFENWGINLEGCGVLIIRNYIYLDDVLATGGTFKQTIQKYIIDNNLLEPLKNKEVRLLSYFLCLHTWGGFNCRYSLKKAFDEEDYFMNLKAFEIKCHYKVENNLKDHNPRLNLMYPQQSKNEYDVYLSSLDSASAQFNRAYRGIKQPYPETFFSSNENRIRLEQIFLDKGIEIINKINATGYKHRPLGKTYISYKTFGTGTLFFTWRNISNTCPIVLWWDNPAHNWKGLFPLYNRGN